MPARDGAPHSEFVADRARLIQHVGNVEPRHLTRPEPGERLRPPHGAIVGRRRLSRHEEAAQLLDREGFDGLVAVIRSTTSRRNRAAP